MDHKVDWQRQEEIEAMSLEWGIKTYTRRLEEALKADPTRVGAGRRLLYESVRRTEALVQLWIDENGSRRGRKHTALKWFMEAGAPTVAFLACRAVLQALGQQVTATEAARGFAGDLIGELKARRFKERAPGLFQYREASFSTNNAAHIARSLAGTMKTAVCTECYQAGHRGAEQGACPHLDMSDLDLPQTDRLRVGLKAIDFMLEAFPGWIERVNETTRTKGAGIKTNSYLVITTEAQDWLDNRNEMLAELIPVYLPMVVPPLKWAQGVRGGYRFGLREREPMVRGTSLQQKLVDEHALPTVYGSLNRIQETPWRVNERVLAVAEQVMELGGDRAGIPRLDPLEKPMRPSILDREHEADPEEFRRALREYKRSVSQWHGDELHRVSEARPFHRIVEIARMFDDEPAIWFPWSLDFRGRAYPIPQYLQPQGCDLAKGLLEFADGAPVGERGIYWLAVHGANTLDEWRGQKVSKLTLDKRAELIHSISHEIVAVAEDPIGNRMWWDADEPWQFLAFCFEWAGVVREGEAYVSHARVAVDGACNGLQHFSALLLDPEGARAVNVRANPEPEDVYLRVAEVARDRLQEEAATEPMARAWLASGLVDRKMCKRPTMTYAYGSGRFGWTDQILGELKKNPEWPELEARHFSTVNETTGEIISTAGSAASYLAGIFEKALSRVVSGAYEAREWMQKAARVVVKGGKPVRWWAPETDFPVVQDGLTYWERNEIRVDTHLGGVRFQPLVETKTNKPSFHRQANGIAPNFVHSLDAAAMMLTVEAAAEDGVGHFAMVHDSFGTLPAHMDSLLRATRESFFRLYSRHDPLNELYFQLMDQHMAAGGDPEELEDPPSRGDLNLSEVLVSDYFFS